MSIDYGVTTIGWKERLSAFWLAWKYILIVLALLAISLFFNYRQWRAAVNAKAHAEATTLKQVLDKVEDIGKAKARDDEATYKRLEAIADRAKGTRVVYRNAASAAPLPEQCYPGSERVDAINKSLGPQSNKSPATKDTP